MNKEGRKCKKKRAGLAILPDIPASVSPLQRQGFHPLSSAWGLEDYHHRPFPASFSSTRRIPPSTRPSDADTSARRHRRDLPPCSKQHPLLRGSWSSYAQQRTGGGRQEHQRALSCFPQSMCVVSSMNWMKTKQQQLVWSCSENNRLIVRVRG